MHALGHFGLQRHFRAGCHASAGPCLGLNAVHFKNKRQNCLQRLSARCGRRQYGPNIGHAVVGRIRHFEIHRRRRAVFGQAERDIKPCQLAFLTHTADKRDFSRPGVYFIKVSVGIGGSRPIERAVGMVELHTLHVLHAFSGVAYIHKAPGAFVVTVKVAVVGKRIYIAVVAARQRHKPQSSGIGIFRGSAVGGVHNAYFRRIAAIVVYGKQISVGIVVGHVHVQRMLFRAVGKFGEFAGGHIDSVPRQRHGTGRVTHGIICVPRHRAGAHGVGLFYFCRIGGIRNRECVPADGTLIVADEETHGGNRRLRFRFGTEIACAVHGEDGGTQRGGGQ